MPKTTKTVVTATGAAILVGLAALIVLSFSLWVTTPEGGEAPHPTESTAPGPTGWRGDLQELGIPQIRALPEFELRSASGLPVRGADLNQDAYLYLATRKILGHPPRPWKQEVGDCVGFGTARAVTCLSGVAHQTGSAGGDFARAHPSYIYGTSRVGIGGGRINGDGSLVAWSVAAIAKYGVLSQEAPGAPAYSGGLSRQWGSRGVPDKLKKIAEQFPVETASRINSANDAALAIINGYPLVFGASYGPEGFRTIDGKYVAVGNARWGHCQCVIAYDGEGNGGDRYFYVQNSWGVWGPYKRATPDGPPVGGYWVTWGTMGEIIDQGATFALSNFHGFVEQELDFNLIGGNQNEVDRSGGMFVDGGGSGLDSRRHGHAGSDRAGYVRLGFWTPYRIGEPVPTDRRFERFFARFGAGSGDDQAAFLHGGLVRAVSADEAEGLSQTPRSRLVDWSEIERSHPPGRLGSQSWIEAEIPDQFLADVGLDGGREGDIAGCRLSPGCECGEALQPRNFGRLDPERFGGLFGPDLREVADRVADQVVSEAVEVVKAHKWELTGLLSIVAGTGGLGVVVAIFIGRACLMILDKWLYNRRENP